MRIARVCNLSQTEPGERSFHPDVGADFLQAGPHMDKTSFLIFEQHILPNDCEKHAGDTVQGNSQIDRVHGVELKHRQSKPNVGIEQWVALF